MNSPQTQNRSNRMKFRFNVLNSTFEVDSMNLISHSQLFLNSNPLLAIEQQLHSTIEQLLLHKSIQKESVDIFFELQSNFNSNFPKSFVSDLCFLAKHFEDTELLELLYKYIDEHISDPEFVLSELYTFERNKDQSRYSMSYMTKIDQLAIQYLNFYLTPNNHETELFHKLSIGTHYRLFSKWSDLPNRPSIDILSYLEFINQSLDIRYPLLSFFNFNEIPLPDQIAVIKTIHNDPHYQKYLEFIRFPFDLFIRLSDENDTMKQTIDQVKKEKEQFQQSNDELRQSYEIKYDEYKTQLDKELVLLQKRIKTLEAIVAEFEDQNARLSKRNEEITAQNKELSAQYVKLCENRQTISQAQALQSLAKNDSKTVNQNERKFLNAEKPLLKHQNTIPAQNENESNDTLEMKEEDSSDEEDLIPNGSVIDIPNSDENQFKGILRYLNEITYGNIVTNETVVITSNIKEDSYEDESTLVDDDIESRCQFSGPSHFCIDFKDRKVQVLTYSLRSTIEIKNWFHPKHWILEGSNDQRSWIELDHQKPNDFMNNQSIVHSFTTKKHKFCRYIRFRHIGNTWNNLGIEELRLNGIEFFGKLLD